MKYTLKIILRIVCEDHTQNTNKMKTNKITCKLQTNKIHKNLLSRLLVVSNGTYQHIKCHFVS